MKKIVLMLIIIAATTQLRAQQLVVKPFDSILFKAPTMERYKLSDSSLFKNFSAIAKIPQLTVLADFNNKSPELLYSTMPVVKVKGDIDKMPTVKLSGNVDNMPVKRIKVIPLRQLQQPVAP